MWPTFASMDGQGSTLNDFTFCFNKTSGFNDLVYSPVDNHPNYDIDSCVARFTLILLVGGASFYDTI